MKIKFFHQGEMLSAELMYNFQMTPDIILVKLQKVDDVLLSIISLHFNREKWVSDEFNDRYPETMENLHKAVTIALNGSTGTDALFK